MVLEAKIRVAGVLTATGVYHFIKHSFRVMDFPSVVIRKKGRDRSFSACWVEVCYCHMVRAYELGYTGAIIFGKYLSR